MINAVAAANGSVADLWDREPGGDGLKGLDERVILRQSGAAGLGPDASGCDLVGDEGSSLGTPNRPERRESGQGVLRKRSTP